MTDRTPIYPLSFYLSSSHPLTHTLPGRKIRPHIPPPPQPHPLHTHRPNPQSAQRSPVLRNRDPTDVRAVCGVYVAGAFGGETDGEGDVFGGGEGGAVLGDGAGWGVEGLGVCEDC